MQKQQKRDEDDDDDDDYDDEMSRLLFVALEIIRHVYKYDDDDCWFAL
jgi:hypothetical protein